MRHAAAVAPNLTSYKIKTAGPPLQGQPGLIRITAPRRRHDTPPSMPTFARQIKRLVDALPGDTAEARIAHAAQRCGVSARTIYLWISGRGNPTRATQVGALSLLSEKP
jgi:hypothetical protein